MVSIANSFGSPVTAADGKRARNTSTTVTSGSSGVDISDASCQTVSRRSRPISSLMWIGSPLPISTSSSTIRSTMRSCSILSFFDAASRTAFASSSFDQRPRGKVPFVGRTLTVGPSMLKNRSGDALRM